MSQNRLCRDPAAALDDDFQPVLNPRPNSRLSKTNSNCKQAPFYILQFKQCPQKSLQMYIERDRDRDREA